MISVNRNLMFFIHFLVLMVEERLFVRIAVPFFKKTMLYNIKINLHIRKICCIFALYL